MLYVCDTTESMSFKNTAQFFILAPCQEPKLMRILLKFLNRFSKQTFRLVFIDYQLVKKEREKKTHLYEMSENIAKYDDDDDV